MILYTRVYELQLIANRKFCAVDCTNVTLMSQNQSFESLLDTLARSVQAEQVFLFQYFHSSGSFLDFGAVRLSNPEQTPR